MSSFWVFTLAIILIVAWIVAGGYLTQANVYLRPYKGLDNNFKTAYDWTLYAAIITWVIVGIIVLLVILSVVGVVALFGSGAGEVGVAAAETGEVAEGAEATGEVAEEEAASNPEQEKAREVKDGNKNPEVEPKTSWISIAFFVFAFVLITISGILAAGAASNIIKSPNYDNTNSKMTKARSNCSIAAIICLGSAGVLIIGAIAYWIFEYTRKEREREALARAAAPVVRPTPAVASTATVGPSLTSVLATSALSAFAPPVVAQPVPTPVVVAPQPTVVAAPVAQTVGPAPTPAPSLTNQATTALLQALLAANTRTTA